MSQHLTFIRKRFAQFVIMATIALFVAACGGTPGGGAPATSKQAEEKLPSRIAAASSSIDHLKSSLDGGLIRNASILGEYAKILRSQKPELSSLINNLSQDASSRGAQFKNLSNRFNALKSQPELFESPLAQYQEANALIDAAQPENFNNALVDVVNVLADMSNGSLPRIDSASKRETMAANRSEDLGAGSQLIGNPSYGQWQNNGGTSIWAWYGMYAMFRDLTGGRSYSYNQWDRNRDWSYYNDVGRNRNGNVRSKSNNAPKTKKYGAKRDYGVSKKSYGSSSNERRKSSFGGSSNTKKSAFSKKSSAPASFRNRSSYSRGFFGGK